MDGHEASVRCVRVLFCGQVSAVTHPPFPGEKKTSRFACGNYGGGVRGTITGGLCAVLFGTCILGRRQAGWCGVDGWTRWRLRSAMGRERYMYMLRARLRGACVLSVFGCGTRVCCAYVRVVVLARVCCEGGNPRGDTLETDQLEVRACSLARSSWCVRSPHGSSRVLHLGAHDGPDHADPNWQKRPFAANRR